VIDFRLPRAPRHHHEADDSFALERQAHGKVTLVRHFAGFTPARDLVSSRNHVAVDVLELGLRLVDRELLVAERLLQDLPACHDASNGPSRRHGFDVGIE